MRIFNYIFTVKSVKEHIEEEKRQKPAKKDGDFDRIEEIVRIYALNNNGNRVRFHRTALNSIQRHIWDEIVCPIKNTIISLKYEIRDLKDEVRELEGELAGVKRELNGVSKK